jgi:hypothetical protein
LVVGIDEEIMVVELLELLECEDDDVTKLLKI